MRVFVMALFLLGSTAWAQESERVYELPTGCSCDAVVGLNRVLESTDHAKELRDRQLYDRAIHLGEEFRALCDTRPDDGRFYGGEGGPWLGRADRAAEELGYLLFHSIRGAVFGDDGATMAEVLASILLELQYDLGQIRQYVYLAVRTEFKEVIREVAAPCPEPEDPCEQVLRDASGRWADELAEWTGVYTGTGDDWQHAKRSIPQLQAVARGEGNPLSYLLGWLAQWDSIHRHGSSSFLGSGPMPHIARDMSVQLSLCGIFVPGFRR